MGTADPTRVALEAAAAGRRRHIGPGDKLVAAGHQVGGVGHTDPGPVGLLAVGATVHANVGAQRVLDLDRVDGLAAGQDHDFEARDDNRFVVADVPDGLAPMLDRLPCFVQLDAGLEHYVQFLHAQLQQGEEGSQTQHQMLLLLIQLLHERFGDRLRLDRRVDLAKRFIDEHYHQKITVNQLATIAHQQFNLLTTYDVTDRLMLGVQSNWKGEVKLGSLAPNDNRLPSYWSFDLVGSYDINDRMDVRFGVKNAGDEVYYDTAYRSGEPFTYVAPGREAWVAIDMKF